MSSERNTLRQALYDRVCESYHAVDDFRMKLLGLLPVATGTGVFLLLNGKADLLGKGDSQVSDALLATGIFGILFTLGLFLYELFGIKKCHYLIVTGKRLEVEIGLHGQFRSRPRELAGFINEPYASAIIYPASMAAWAFLALSLRSTIAAALVAVVVFFAGYKATRYGARRIKENQEREDAVLTIVTENGPMTVDSIKSVVGAAAHGSPHGATGVKARLHGFARHLQRPSTREPDWVADAVARVRERGDLERENGLVFVKSARRGPAPLDAAPPSV